MININNRRSAVPCCLIQLLFSCGEAAAGALIAAHKLAQTVDRLTVTAKRRVKSKTSGCAICDGYCDNEPGLSAATVSIIPPTLFTHFFKYPQMLYAISNWHRFSPKYKHTNFHRNFWQSLYQTTRRHIPVYYNPNNHYRQNFPFHIINYCLCLLISLLISLLNLRFSHLTKLGNIS